MTNASIGLNILVAIWLLITGLGVLQAWQLLYRANSAKDWLISEGLNGIRLHAANAAIRMGRARIFVQCCLFLMGVDAIVLQFFDQGTPIRNMLSGVFRLLMIAVAGTLTFKSRMEIHELDRILGETEKLRVHERNLADLADIDAAHIMSQDMNTAELHKNTVATEANTVQRQTDAEASDG